MGWTTPTDRSTGYTVTAADWNIVEDNLTFLYGDTGWTNMSGFTNSWTALGSPNVPRYRLVGSMVTVQGAITGGTINTTAFTFPVGYRPTQTVTFATDANAAYGRFSIGSSGVLNPLTGSTSNFGLACTFSVL